MPSDARPFGARRADRGKLAMSIRILAATSAFVLVAACNQSATNNMTVVANVSTTNTSAPAPVAAPAPQPGAGGPAAEGRFQQYAACASTMMAVARLYSSIATQQSGAEREAMMARATARETAATAFHDMAVQVGASIGRTAADVDRVRAETDAQIEQARQRMPFEQFAATAAREGDQCTRLGQQAT